MVATEKFTFDVQDGRVLVWETLDQPTAEGQTGRYLGSLPLQDGRPLKEFCVGIRDDGNGHRVELVNAADAAGALQMVELKPGEFVGELNMRIV